MYDCSNFEFRSHEIEICCTLSYGQPTSECLDMVLWVTMNNGPLLHVLVTLFRRSAASEILAFTGDHAALIPWVNINNFGLPSAHVCDVTSGFLQLWCADHSFIHSYSFLKCSVSTNIYNGSQWHSTTHFKLKDNDLIQLRAIILNAIIFPESLDANLHFQWNLEFWMSCKQNQCFVPHDANLKNPCGEKCRWYMERG